MAESAPSPRLPLFVKRDLDGFFGLFVDNLVQLLLIVALTKLCGMGEQPELLLEFILPGAAVSLLVGNVYYAWQAHRLARRTGRDDVTALPYGINTPSLLVYIFFVMMPVYERTGDPKLAWVAGLVACIGSALIEIAGAFVAGSVRKATPRAALLTALSGIAIGFISMKFALEIFQRPLVAMLPLGVVLLTYFAKVRFPIGLPGGFLAVLIGTLCAWVLPLFTPERLLTTQLSWDGLRESTAYFGFFPPVFVGETVWEFLQEPENWQQFLSVIVPMGLFNVVGSLQNVESASAAGDDYNAAESLAVNGVGSLLAGLFGSCFPTTIYIGHPGWKELGARAGYSTLNGIVVTLICLTGSLAFIQALIPLEAGIAIVLWIGVIITAQAFQTTPMRHAPAIAVGLFPAIAAWGATVMMGTFTVFVPGAPAGPTIEQALRASLSTEVNGFLIHGMILLERGYIFTCMILGAVSAFLIDRKFYAAAMWSAVASAFTFLGLMHAYQVNGSVVDYLFRFDPLPEAGLGFRADGIAIGYLALAVLFAVAGATVSKDELRKNADSISD